MGLSFADFTATHDCTVVEQGSFAFGNGIKGLEDGGEVVYTKGGDHFAFRLITGFIVRQVVVPDVALGNSLLDSGSEK